MAIREYGARKTTMIHIAAAAGIAKGTLYNHVRTRSDAYRLLAEIEVGRLVDLLRPDEDVADVLQRASEFVATHPVIRSLAEQEPGALALVCLPGPLTEAGRTAVERSVEELVGPDAAPLVLRWLVSLMLDPADQAVRADQAATLAAIAESNRPPAT
jgi:AcrR family transcriptional regulator